MERKPRVWLHVLLFALTVITTTYMGGWIYSVGLISILTAHEFGHYFGARYHRVKATLPYFIPAPPPFIFGTFGAVIRMSAQIPTRRALFDIAAAGPIAGVLIAIPLSVIGIAISQYSSVSQKSGAIILGDPLLFRAVEWIIFGTRNDGVELFLHPIGFAGWVGLFVTALNLLPIGQLDGGHISYAIFGHVSKLVTRATFIVMVAISFWTSHQYLLILLLIWFMGIKHPPTLSDSSNLGFGRKIVGVALAIIFVLSFTPTPFRF